MKKELRRTLLFWLEKKRLFTLKRKHQLWGIEAINEALLGSTIGLPALLRTFGAQVGVGSVIHGPLIIHNAKRDYANLRIGNRTHIGRDVLLDLSCPIEIGDDAVISMRCSLLTHQDVGDRPLATKVARTYLPLTIGARAYLGSGVTVLAGAHVGAGAIVGAGAVVAKAVEADTVVAGVPARLVNSDR